MSQLLTSVGIDIGTSTTQLVFCKLKVENTASAWTVPTVRIADKQIFYKSDIHFTPLIDAKILDASQIRQLIINEYKKANIDAKQVDTGAVIITGEAARKENAEQIITMLSDLAGDFVVTTAGPDLEGILSGKGSGAFAYSKAHACSVMNFDIGGGTTNIAMFKNGEVLDSACFDIGGRLIKINSQNKISYISKKAQMLIDYLNISLKIGDVADITALDKVAQTMAQVLFDIVTGNYEEPVLRLLITNHGLKANIAPTYICLSGGIADCTEDTSQDIFRYGDIGLILGRAIKARFDKSGTVMLKADETIRATVIGAGIHTTDISGSTINYDDHILPLKNIPVIKLSKDEEHTVGEIRIQHIKKRVEWVVHEGAIPLVNFAIRGSKHYNFEQLQSLARDIVAGLDRIVQSKQPLIVTVENDMAKALGLCIRKYLPSGKSLICIDTIRVENGDYIDIGEPVADGQVLPVIIKTLLFHY